PRPRPARPAPRPPEPFTAPPPRPPAPHADQAQDVHDTTLRWSMHLGTSSTRRPSSALRALLDLVDLHVIAL
ncbi:hypothetical protein ABZ599_36775, partial [Streptomyces misionensis]